MSEEPITNEVVQIHDQPALTSSQESADENSLGPEAAEQVMARSGRTFHLAARLLPRQMRLDATALYAFCRRMDDLADEAVTHEGSALQARQIAELHDTVRILGNDPLGEAAEAAGWPVELEARYPGISKVAVTLTQALAADTGPCRVDSQHELQHYAFGVAGTVGLMMCPYSWCASSGCRGSIPFRDRHAAHKYSPRCARRLQSGQDLPAA